MSEERDKGSWCRLSSPSLPPRKKTKAAFPGRQVAVTGALGVDSSRAQAPAEFLANSPKPNETLSLQESKQKYITQRYII